MCPNYSTYIDNMRRGEPVYNPVLDTLDVKTPAVGEGTCTMTMPCRPDLMQSAGNMQGGLIVTLADECIGTAAMTLLADEEDLVTTQLSFNFLGPGRLNDTLIAEAGMIKQGRTLLVGEATVKNQDGRLVGHCVATFMILRPR